MYMPTENATKRDSGVTDNERRGSYILMSDQSSRVRAANLLNKCSYNLSPSIEITVAMTLMWPML